MVTLEQRSYTNIYWVTGWIFPRSWVGARVGFVEKEDLFKTGFKLHVIGSWCLQRGLERVASTCTTQFKTSFVQVGSQWSGRLRLCAWSSFTALFVLYTSTFSTAKCFVERVDSGKHWVIVSAEIRIVQTVFELFKETTCYIRISDTI